MKSLSNFITLSLPKMNKVYDLLEFLLKLVYLKIGPKFTPFFNTRNETASGAMPVFRADRDERTAFRNLALHEQFLLSAFCMCRTLAKSCKICCNKGVKTGKRLAVFAVAPSAGAWIEISPPRDPVSDR